MTSFKAQLALLSAVSTLSSGVLANSFGNSWSIPAPALPNFIRVANATLILPATAANLNNDLSLWTGMGMTNGDLVQALAISGSPTTTDGGCGNLGPNKYCVVGSTLEGGNYQAFSNQRVLAYTGDSVGMSYIYNSGTTQTDQYVSINGQVVATFSSSAGAHPQGYGTAEECQPGTPCGTVPQHQWVDVAFVLDQADPSFGSKAGGSGDSGGSLSSPDGGITWYASTITINAYDFTTGQ